MIGVLVGGYGNGYENGNGSGEIRHVPAGKGGQFPGVGVQFHRAEPAEWVGHMQKQMRWKLAVSHC